MHSPQSRALRECKTAHAAAEDRAAGKPAAPPQAHEQGQQGRHEQGLGQGRDEDDLEQEPALRHRRQDPPRVVLGEGVETEQLEQDRQDEGDDEGRRHGPRPGAQDVAQRVHAGVEQGLGEIAPEPGGQAVHAR